MLTLIKQQDIAPPEASSTINDDDYLLPSLECE